MADPAWPGLDADQEVAAEQAAEDQPAAADASEYDSDIEDLMRQDTPPDYWSYKDGPEDEEEAPLKGRDTVATSGDAEENEQADDLSVHGDDANTPEPPPAEEPIGEVPALGGSPDLTPPAQEPGTPVIPSEEQVDALEDGDGREMAGSEQSLPAANETSLGQVRQDVTQPSPNAFSRNSPYALACDLIERFCAGSQDVVAVDAVPEGPFSGRPTLKAGALSVLPEDDGDDSERSNDPSDSDTTPEQVCALQQLLMGIFDKVLKVSVTKSLPGHDVEAVALHVISDSPPLPPSLLAELYAGDGKWRARVEALLVAWGHNNTEWALSKVGGNTSTPLSQDPGQPSCPGADAAVTPPSYATTTEAGAAEVEREGVGMDCGGQFNVVMDQLFASHAPSSVMSVARHFSNGSTKLTLLSSNPHSAPPAAVDFQRLGDFGDQLRKCPPLSSEMDTLVETMGEMLRNLSLGQGPLPIGPPTVSSPVLRLEGVAADGPKRKAKAAAKRFTSGKKRSSQQENVSAAPLRLAKAEKKAAGKASKDAAAAGGNAQHILPPPFQPLSNVPAAAASEVAALQAGSSSIAPASASSTFTPGDDGGGMSAVQNAFGVIGATPAAAAGEIAAVGLSDATQARMVRYELLALVPFEDLWMYSGDAENVRALQEQEMVEKVMWDAVVSDPDGGREADWDRFSDALLASKLEASEAVQQELDELRAEFGA